MISSSYFSAGLLQERERYSFSRAGFLSVFAQEDARTGTTCFTQARPFPTRTTVIFSWQTSTYKVCKKKKKQKTQENALPANFWVNAAPSNLFTTTFHVCTFFFFLKGLSLTKIHNSCCPLRRLDHWHYVERGFVQLQRVIFVVVLLLSLHSDAMPSLHPVTSFPSQFLIHPLMRR